MLFIALVVSLLGAGAAHAGGNQTVNVGLPSCAGTGGSWATYMNGDYQAMYSGCGVEVTLTSGGCNMSATMISACIPSTGTWTVAEVEIFNPNQSLNSVWLVRVVDGLVQIDEVEI